LLLRDGRGPGAPGARPPCERALPGLPDEGLLDKPRRWLAGLLAEDLRAARRPRAGRRPPVPDAGRPRPAPAGARGPAPAALREGDHGDLARPLGGGGRSGGADPHLRPGLRRPPGGAPRDGGAGRPSGGGADAGARDADQALRHSRPHPAAGADPRPAHGRGAPGARLRRRGDRAAPGRARHLSPRITRTLSATESIESARWSARTAARSPRSGSSRAPLRQAGAAGWISTMRRKRARASADPWRVSSSSVASVSARAVSRRAS